jgi:hypothetical protein
MTENIYRNNASGIVYKRLNKNTGKTHDAASLTIPIFLPYEIVAGDSEIWEASAQYTDLHWMI